MACTYLVGQSRANAASSHTALHTAARLMDPATAAKIDPVTADPATAATDGLISTAERSRLREPCNPAA